MVNDFRSIPDAIPDSHLRAQITNYFAKVLIRRKDKEPTQKETAEAARKTLLAFPQLIDYFIRFKEEHGDDAESISSRKVIFSEQMYVAQIKALQHMLVNQTKFYETAGNTYEEARQRLEYLRDLIENKGCHKIFYVDDQPIQREEDIHVMYRLVWFGTPSDVSREANDGRGPADFKIARGALDKTIVEFKLAKNSQLARNLEKQVEVYQKASDAKHSIKAIVFFSEQELERVTKILKNLDLYGHPDIFLIDARRDNKPSGSKA